MRDPQQQLRLMQLASGSLPVGSFTWSQGLEWAVESGWVKNVEAFALWQKQQMMQNLFSVDLPLFNRLYHACEQDDLDAAHRWTAYLLACRETRELREEERSRGAAFTRLVVDWQPDCPAPWRALFADSQLCGMAWLGVQWRITLADLTLSLGYSWIESAVMAGVKLVPFGQQAAQRLIISLCEDFAQGMGKALACPDEELGGATPLATIASARHETQYCRLFRS
ncbi:urease accessory protein UreF [Citrobacter amalonaticus]|uniref:Urease accessory protein UreF n=1 Tax=Citrobacter amalonaticus TaxID=35703 RepID=A0A2S4RTF6_CITAM|nr:urease accessory protein UreF [Citrobacter amalonaticus]POT56821.1 urease accessory protein UreF [Citrobacter amalonaticus]POT71934.1 urease accessory protein UreF [Citrobacter amalonaticus]POU63073.1 urease accessory protein UreF [Citrobacter amalonaticus]POV04713.1 urease accessory protein UreF [Citrobacter amalonaticus]